MKRYFFCLLVVFASMVSCEKDENVGMGRKSKFIGYDILLSDDFKQGKTKSGETVGEDKKVTIDMFEGELGGESLYLHTIEQEWQPDAQATKGAVISSLAGKGMGVSAWVYKTDAYEGGQSYFSNDEHSVGSGAVTTGRYWPQQKDGWNMRFYAYAPVDAQNGEASADGSVSYVTLPDASEWTGGVPSFSYTVPSDVTRQADLLVASSDVQNGSDAYGTAAVPMDFGHALTAVQFMVDPVSLENFIIHSITISGVNDSGTYTYAYSGVNGDGTTQIVNAHDAGVWNVIDTQDANYTLDFTEGDLEAADGETGNGGFSCAGNGDKKLNAGNYVLFLMPQELGVYSYIEVKGYDTENNKDMILSSSTVGKVWEKGKNVIYKISASDIAVEYVFEVSDVTTESDIAFKASETVETKIPDVVTVPYYGQLERRYKVISHKKTYKVGQVDPDVTYLQWSIDRDETSDWIDWIQEPVFTEGYNGELDGTYNVVAGVPNGASHYNLFQNAHKGTADSPYDLSEGTETANCYIVDAPGYYKLPLIYGNARGADGNINASSYSTSAAQGGTISATNNAGNNVSVSVNVLSWFMNYNGEPIYSPYIPMDVEKCGGTIDEAKVIWQDEPCLVTELEIKDGHLCFRVREDCICEGNAVIAIKAKDTYETDSEGKQTIIPGTIYWSWHIWVTDNFIYDPVSVDVFNRRLLTEIDGTQSSDNFANFVSEKFKMMRTYIGYCDGEQKEYAERRGKIVFIQKDEDGKQHGRPVELEVAQEGKTVSVQDNTMYYQYGRKDPRPAAYAQYGDNTKTKNKEYYLANRRQYHQGYDGMGAVGFHQRSSQESERELMPMNYGIQNPGIQMPNWNNNETDQNDYDYDSGVYDELGSWKNIRAGFWYNSDVYGRPLNLVNLWNANSNVLPMFTYLPPSLNGYQTLAAANGNLEQLIALGVTKTIYDPSPRGYEMPRVDAFMGFTYDGLNTKENDAGFVNINTSTGLESIGGYYFFRTPMDAIGVPDNSASRPIPIKALGYRNNSAGALAGYRTYGSALTSAPICVEWGSWTTSTSTDGSTSTTYNYNGYFSLQLSKLYFLYDPSSPLVYPMSSSDFSIAFPVIPIKTGANPVAGSAVYYNNNNIPESYEVPSSSGSN